MIHLRQMRADEFADFLAYFVPDYAAEISANYDVDIDLAHERASQAVNTDLASGVETPGQVLLCIVCDGDETDLPVGYLWCKPDTEAMSVFISDFCIRPVHRGKGFATRALKELEVMFGETGYSEIRLRVAADNKTAQRLYLGAGFQVTGINMKKSIEME